MNTRYKHWFFRYKLHHILFWLAYFIFWTGMSMQQYPSSVSVSLLYTTVWFAGQAACIYIGMYWLIPRCFNARRYGAFALSLLLDILICTLFITFTLTLLTQKIAPDADVRPGQFFMFVLMANTYGVSCMLAAKIIKERIIADRRNKLLEKEQMQQELSFLRAQMNPHFLFNAINSIYVLIRKDPEVAAQTLAKFSDMLRYQLYECTTEHIPVEKELGYLDHYIALEKIRKGDTVQIGFSVSDTMQHFQIAPLLIIPFVENAFKHLSTNGGGENFIHISLDYRAPHFSLRVENSKDQVPLPYPAGGIGLANVKRRLELLYPGKHHLRTEDTGNKYLVLLNIELS